MKRNIEDKLNSMELKVKEMEAVVRQMKDKKFELNTQKGIVASIRNLIG